MQTSFLVTLQVLPFQKFILDKIPHMGWRRGQSTKFNLRKIDLKLVFGYISPCIFFFENCLYNSSIIIEIFLKCGLYDHGTHFKVKQNIFGLYGHLWPLRGPNQFFFNFFFYSSIINLSIDRNYKLWKDYF